MTPMRTATLKTGVACPIHPSQYRKIIADLLADENRTIGRPIAVASYFAKRLHNDSCGCCIRLAAISGGNPGYETRARSRSLGVGRRERSEPIFEDSSFVRMLKDKDSLGVWLLNDLKLASESKLWPDLKNNELMHFDSVMIAPVNTVIDNKKSMTGILFVTAKGRHWKGR